MRIGLGYDIHRTDPARPLILGGIEIAEGPGLMGHSDADALLHAITDALLGALGEPNVGELFPNTDPRYANCASHVFVEEALTRVKQHGMRIINVDTVVVAQRPRLSPHRVTIVHALEQLLHVSPGCVNMKATTSEGLGPMGAGEGIAVQAVVLLESATL
jgi:2-C-methyl-D-erythritol 2,4-cyclodiphosphate synthase